MAHYLGNSVAAGALRAALRIPNFLQNLLGEGVLSASFIPVYARLRNGQRDAEAQTVALTVGSLLAVVASLLTLLGVVFAAPLVDVLAAGFSGPTRALTVSLVRILFPGVALLVLAAWCLGVLNSHRRFFLSYASPVLWNCAIITAAVVAGLRGEASASMVRWLAWGATIGSALQLLVQLPVVWRLVGGLRPRFAYRDAAVLQTLRAFGPVILGRGSVQLSAYLDGVLASYLGAGMVAALGYAQILYLLPISLFGMAISAAELPEMAQAGEPAAVATALQARLRNSLRRVVFFVVPSAVGFAMLGDWMVGVLFQTGAFSARDTVDVWIVLAGSALGLAAGTQGRLLASALYALGDTKAPLWAALVRVGLTFVVGWAVVFPARAHWGYAPVWAAFGLTASAGAAAWLEFVLLRFWLQKRIGAVPVPTGFGLLITALALAAGAAAFGLGRLVLAVAMPHLARAILVLATFAVCYGLACLVARVPEVHAVMRRVRKTS